MCVFQWQDQWGTQSVCPWLHEQNMVSVYSVISQRGSYWWVWSETSHSNHQRFPTPMWGCLGLFSCFTLSHTPFPTLAQHQNKNDTVEWPPVVWHMGFIRERDLKQWVWGARRESNPYFICIHLSSSKSYQLSITGTRISTVGWQEPGLINSWLITKTPYW